MRFTIDGASGTAPFDQVRSQIVAAVRSGQLIAGSKLPTVRALAATLDLAPNTVAKAYRELEKDGVIETRGRSGTFVAAGGDPSAGAVQLAATEYVRAARRAGIDDEVALRYVRMALADS
ncbi:GntR family transcriptional regulator [Rhodococcus sp. BP-241]|uniref:GntR family transcriptional regulator n=1 Tax=Rhodococcus sp. BP-241 TaxID=2739441 RepID=UPI001C9AA781|nr:GntR family transcriptional regulator [Rhodococcus sp. BP-241]MBY6706899.1 GntR family transcriptional regulator [Rhodococcus sp. BP-241]